MPSKYPSNRVEAATDIANVIKLMSVFTDTMTFEQREKSKDELMQTYLERPGDLDDYQKEEAMELIHKKQTYLENEQKCSKARRERNKELINTYQECPGDLNSTQTTNCARGKSY